LLGNTLQIAHDHNFITVCHSDATALPLPETILFHSKATVSNNELVLHSNDMTNQILNGAVFSYIKLSQLTVQTNKKYIWFRH